MGLGKRKHVLNCIVKRLCRKIWTVFLVGVKLYSLALLIHWCHFRPSSQPRHHAQIVGCRHRARDEEHGWTYGNYNVSFSFTKKGHVVMRWVSVCQFLFVLSVCLSVHPLVFLFVYLFVDLPMLHLYVIDVPSSFRADQYSVLTGSKDCSMKIWSLSSGKLSTYETLFGW